MLPRDGGVECCLETASIFFVVPGAPPGRAREGNLAVHVSARMHSAHAQIRDARSGMSKQATPCCCMLRVFSTRFLTPDDGAQELKNSWFGRLVVGRSC